MFHINFIMITLFFFTLHLLKNKSIELKQQIITCLIQIVKYIFKNKINRKFYYQKKKNLPIFVYKTFIPLDLMSFKVVLGFHK